MSAWNFKDLTGQKFGRLTVLERVENKGEQPCWRCRCDCGNIRVVQGGDLKNGRTQSCGCLRKERITTHGMRNSKIYVTWANIKRRCFNPNCKDYAEYGGRGITMYPAWINNPAAFFSYVSQLPHYGESGYTLDRIENNGNYEPGNLRWATQSEQQRNTRQNVIVEYQGEKMTLAESAERSGINYAVLKKRYQHGDRGARLFRPVKKGGGENEDSHRR